MVSRETNAFIFESGSGVFYLMRNAAEYSNKRTNQAWYYSTIRSNNPPSIKERIIRLNY